MFIDCHVHVIASTADLGACAALPNSLAAFRTAGLMRDMLARGFTTVRDLGGADIGIVTAQAEGAIVVLTSITYDLLRREGEVLGLPSESVAKVSDIRDADLEALATLAGAGVIIGYGLDCRVGCRPINRVSSPAWAPPAGP